MYISDIDDDDQDDPNDPYIDLPKSTFDIDCNSMISEINMIGIAVTIIVFYILNYY